MLTDEERQIVEHGKETGKTKQEVINALTKYRSGVKPTQSAQKPNPAPGGIFGEDGFVGKTARKVTDFLGLGAATETFGKLAARGGFGPQTREEGQRYVEKPTGKEVAGAVLQTGALTAGAAIPANLGLKAGLAAGVGAGYAYDIGQKLAEGKDLDEAAIPGVGAAAGFVGPVAGPAAKGAGKAAKAVGKVVTDSPVVRGALGVGTEFAERVPRFMSRTKATIRDAATRADRIASSPAPIGNAIKAGVDERIINTIEQADEPTRKGYADIVRLAEESVDTTGTLKANARPEIVAGEAASAQYKLIEAQRRKVGQEIGSAVENLSKDAPVSMRGSYDDLDEALREIGIGVQYNENGVSLNFGKTGFTKAQRAKINELYDLATEGGDNLTPAEIHAKDRLFSQLQRETRMEGIGDIMVPIGDSNVSLFRVFRDVYSDTLEEVAPEIKPLNKQYRNLVTFLDDIEGSIVKSGNFETNSRLDPAEFAQTNLRRLFSEAQSAADYRAIADEMDAAARALGYEGAVPADLAQFAYEIRKIYPETTPRTGFEGSIKSVGDAIGHVLSAGKADHTDQQKALRELIDSLQ